MSFIVGDCVVMKSDDYSFRGVVVAVFKKLSGAERYVVENSDGLLLIFDEVVLTLEPKNELEERACRWAYAYFGMYEPVPLSDMIEEAENSGFTRDEIEAALRIIKARQTTEDGVVYVFVNG